MSRAGWLALACVLCATGCEEHVISGRTALTREELLKPETCRDCHPKHYAEWSESMHAYAARDPVFLAMNQRGQEETAGKLGPFCVNCHAPMAVHEDAVSDYTAIQALPEHLKGVTCYFCHNAVGIGSEHNNAHVELADDTTMRANLDRTLIPSVHNVKRSVLHDSRRIDSSRLCGTCHDIVMPNGFHLERTLQEYEDSLYSQTTLPGGFKPCQSCHMRTQERALAAVQSGIPGVATHQRTVHEHLFAAVDLPLEAAAPHAAALRSAVEDCELQDSLTAYFKVEAEERANVRLVFETTAGHRQPSGAAQDRRMWFEVDGFDESGKLIYSEGKLEDGELETAGGADNAHPCMLHDEIVDEHGEPTHMFWNAAKLKGDLKTIPAGTFGTPHTNECRFKPRLVQPIAHLELRLRMRAMGMDVLSDLVASGHLADDVSARMPTLNAGTWHADYDATKHAYTLSDNAHKQDCTSYACAIYPDGAGCSAQQGPTAGSAP